MKHKVFLGVALLAFLLLVARAAGAELEAIVAVSPGSNDRVAIVESRCPTFSWGAGTADRYQLLVYRLGEEGEEAEAVLREVVRSTSWTPALDRCLERGARYAWSVRAVGSKAASSWSAPSLFQVAAGPSAAEFEAALQVLRRYVGTEGELTGETGQLSPAASSTADSEMISIAQPPIRRVPRRDALAGVGPSTSREALGSASAPSVVPTDYSLSIDQDFDLGGYVFKDGSPFLHGGEHGNTALGVYALQSVTPGGPGVGQDNTALGRSALADNSYGSSNTAVGAGASQNGTGGLQNTALGSYALYLNDSSFNTGVGFQALYRSATGTGNTAVGNGAARGPSFPDFMTGTENTAVGFESLHVNSSGSQNTAVGAFALHHVDGVSNTAVGWSALAASESIPSTGEKNTAVGVQAAKSTIGSSNTAVGFNAIGGALATGSNNTAVGRNALLNVGSGSDNVALGYYAGSSVTTGANNIHIANSGASADTGVIKIGAASDHTATFIAGIWSHAMEGTEVVVNSNGRLGKKSSSRRYKEAIRDIGQESAGVFDLRPVSFRFRPSGGAARPGRQFGLIAEEVAELLPELVIFDDQGRPDAVRYDVLSSLLVNEMQRQEREIGALRRSQSSLRAQLLALLLLGAIVTVVRGSRLG